MRLTCPNCNAQYEVDERVIPENGRDVQCSACGHTWYQYPKEIALSLGTPLPTDPDGDEDHDEDASMPPPADAARRATAPRIDQSVLDVLREEADRELTERRRSQNDLETQGDLGLTRPARPSTPPRRPDPVEPVAPPPPAPEPEPRRQEPDHPSRRTVLPNIEELTSTLEPGREANAADLEAEATAKRRGFRSGFSTVVLIAMFVIAVYVLAPVISTFVPALDGVLTTYVGVIDDLRATVSGQLRALIGG